MDARIKSGHDGVRCGADAQPCRQFLSRAADGILDGARAGRADYGEADAEAGGGDGGGGVSFVARMERSGMRGRVCKKSRIALRSIRATLARCEWRNTCRYSAVRAKLLSADRRASTCIARRSSIGRRSTTGCRGPNASQ